MDVLLQEEKLCSDFVACVHVSSAELNRDGDWKQN